VRHVEEELSNHDAIGHGISCPGGDFPRDVADFP
jgi:hypothetical protein